MNANSSPTINNWLSNAQIALKNSGSSSPHLDALLLLEHILKKDRAYLLAHPELPLKNESLTALDALLARRINHEPIAYIIGKTEFYGRDFIVNKHVLEPRPESETMIELLKQLSPQDGTIIDVGTGSGALAITAFLELGSATVIATDIDGHCLKVAERNCREYGVDIRLVHTDVLEGVSISKNTVILANLPYVPDAYRINHAAMMEPRLAIFGGEDGLDLYRQLFKQLSSKTHQPQVLTESLPFQHKELVEIAAKYGYTQQNEDDFIQLFSFGA